MKCSNAREFVEALASAPSKMTAQVKAPALPEVVLEVEITHPRGDDTYYLYIGCGGYILFHTYGEEIDDILTDANHFAFPPLTTLEWVVEAYVH